MYGRKAWDIVGYIYAADTYCPECIVDALPTGPGEAFDGWRAVAEMATELNLDEIAAAFGIDRADESSFDSGDFPKVIFSSQLEETERCEACGIDLLYV